MEKNQYMRKKIISTVLSTILVVGLCSPVYAADLKQIEAELKQKELEMEQQLDSETEETEPEYFQSGYSEDYDRNIFQEGVFAEGEFGEPDEIWSDGEIPAFMDGSSESDSDEIPDVNENPEEKEDISYEKILEVKDGDDITAPLNSLLYEVKDLATDDHPYKVIIPPGNYELTGTISTYSNISLYAAGAVITKTSPRKEVMLRLGSPEDMVGGYNGYRNITVEGGTWDANYKSVADKEQKGGFVDFRIGHATNVIIKDITFLNNLKSHFIELGGVKHAQIIGCTFHGYWKEYEEGGQECIQIDSCIQSIFPEYMSDGSICEDILIQNNVFDDVFAGVGSHSMMFDRPYKNIVISDNTFTNIKKRAVWCLNYQDSVVKNNLMKNVGGGVYVRSIYAKHTYFLDGQRVSNKQNQLSENVIVEDNRIYMSDPCMVEGKLWRNYGIWVSGGEYKGKEAYNVPEGCYVIKGVTVKNNLINGSGDGIYFGIAGSCECTGNYINLRASDQITNIGIAGRRCSKVQFLENNITGGKGPGIYMSDSIGTKKKLTISDNSVSCCQGGGIWFRKIPHGSALERNIIMKAEKDGIYGQSSSDVSVKDNTVTGNNGKGILVGSCISAKISDNTVTRNQSDGIQTFSKCNNGIISDNYCGTNKGKGIQILDTTGVVACGNLIRKNKSYGFTCKNSSIKKYAENSLKGNGYSDKIYSKNSKIKYAK